MNQDLYPGWYHVEYVFNRYYFKYWADSSCVIPNNNTVMIMRVRSREDCFAIVDKIDEMTSREAKFNRRDAMIVLKQCLKNHEKND